MGTVNQRKTQVHVTVAFVFVQILEEAQSLHE